jgi:hypothetical protein
MCIGWAFFKPCIEQVVGGEWDVISLIGGAEQWAAILLVVSMLRKRCDDESFLRSHGERCIGDHVNWERR